MRTIICKICGKEAKFKRQAGNAIYCRECSTQLNRDRNRKTARESYYRNKERLKQEKKTAVLCSCGCGKPRTKGFRLLNKECWENAYELHESPCAVMGG